MPDPLIVNLGPVNPGDVVVITGCSEAHFLANLHERLEALCGHRDFLAVALGPGMGIDMIDEALMSQYGWVRSIGGIT